MISVAKEVIKLLSEPSGLAKGIYRDLKSMGYLTGVTKTQFIRAFNSKETPNEVKQYLLQVYLGGHNISIISRDVLGVNNLFGTSGRRNMITMRKKDTLVGVGIKDKKLMFFNWKTKRFLKSPYQNNPNLITGDVYPFLKHFVENEHSLDVIPFVYEVINTLGYIETVCRTCFKWIVALFYVNYKGTLEFTGRKSESVDTLKEKLKEEPEKIDSAILALIEDLESIQTRFIKGLCETDEFTVYFTDILDGLHELEPFIKRFNDPKIESVLINMKDKIKEIISLLGELQSDIGWEMEAEPIADELMTLTKDVDRKTSKLSDLMLNTDLTKFDREGLRKDFRIPTFKSEYRVRVAKTNKVYLQNVINTSIK